LNAYNSAVQAREQALINASTSITNATLSLNQTTAGARAEDVASARASLLSAELTYENTIVRAPFAGQIGSVSAAVGQQTNSQAGIATIITKDKIAQISLNEIDIVNVKLGQSVDLSFDAIPGEKFKGSVSQIDTIGISTSNVVSFAVKISIPNADERIKSGMSVTAEIIIEGKENVLTVPSGTIKTEGDKFYVMKLKSGGASMNIVSSSTASSTRGNFAGRKNRNTTVAAADADNEKVYVTVGMTNDIDTEILTDENSESNSLKEGDKVVSKTVTSGAVTTTTSAPSAFSLFGGGNRGVGGTGGGQRTGGNTAR
jgi:HlyD family secretion protein